MGNFVIVYYCFIMFLLIVKMTSVCVSCMGQLASAWTMIQQQNLNQMWNWVSSWKTEAYDQWCSKGGLFYRFLFKLDRVKVRVNFTKAYFPWFILEIQFLIVSIDKNDEWHELLCCKDNNFVAPNPAGYTMMKFLKYWNNSHDFI